MSRHNRHATDFTSVFWASAPSRNSTTLVSGIGRAMIDHVIGFAKARGFTNVRWLTQEFNYAGRKLYDTYRPKSDFILYSVPVEP